MRNSFFFFSSILLLGCVLVGCQEPTVSAEDKSESQISTEKADYTQALLLVQGAPFDVNDKNKVDGAYQAKQQITVPTDLTPQNKWIMFEGPVLENDKVAYRYYADSRHRFDIYGKRVGDLVMDTVSWQYHDIMDWGSDILKVGNSLGMGSPAIYYEDRVFALEKATKKTIEVLQTGGNKSVIRTVWTDLKIGKDTMDIVQDWSISAGDYFSTIDLSVKDGKLPYGMHFATGIVSHLPEVTVGSTNDYTYLMNWGKQSYHEENLGMAVMAKGEYGPKAVEDELSHLLVFENAPEKVSYRFMAIWEQDQSKTKDAKGFKNMVEQATSRK